MFFSKNIDTFFVSIKTERKIKIENKTEKKKEIIITCEVGPAHFAAERCAELRSIRVARDIGAPVVEWFLHFPAGVPTLSFLLRGRPV